MAVELLDFGDGARDHRQPRREVLPQLEGVRRNGEVVDHEREDRDVEPLAVRRQEAVVLASEQAHVRQGLEAADIRLSPPDQHKRPLRARHGQEMEQLHVHPIGDQTVEADHGSWQRGHLSGHDRVRVTSLTEVFDVHAVRHEERARVMEPLGLVKHLRRYDHQVGLGQESLFHGGHRVLVGVAELGILVDALVDDLSLPERAHDVPGRRKEGPGNRIAEPERAVHPSDRGAP